MSVKGEHRATLHASGTLNSSSDEVGASCAEIAGEGFLRTHTRRQGVDRKTGFPPIQEENLDCPERSRTTHDMFPESSTST